MNETINAMRKRLRCGESKIVHIVYKHDLAHVLGGKGGKVMVLPPDSVRAVEFILNTERSAKEAKESAPTKAPERLPELELVHKQLQALIGISQNIYEELAKFNGTP